MNGFQKHNINHLSASAINLWINAPDVYIAKYLHGHKQAFGLAPRRCQCVETAVHNALTGTDTDKAIANALELFDKTFPIGDEKTTKERALIEPMTHIALEELRPFGTPDAGGDEQHKISIEAKGDGWSIPVIGFLDLTYPQHGLIVDLKTTVRVPTKMSPDHQRQAAIYSAAMGNQSVKFLYCSAKKANWLECEDITEVLRDTKRTIERMERFLSKHSADEALSLIPTNRHSFYWNGDQDGWEKLFGT